jgi:hypothetical protein
MVDLRAYMHHNRSPENVVFFLILLSRDPIPRFSPGLFKMADLRAYLHNNHSTDNVVFSLILLSRDPCLAFSQLIQDGGFACCLPASQS